MPEPEPEAAATEEPEASDAAIRSYLTATITPVLLKGLVKMEEEQCVHGGLSLTLCQ